MPEARPPIPLPVKRLVRQACAFGCVVCGFPLYDYDHIAPYAEAQQHKLDNLVLLCPTHHREKTNGLLPLDTLAAARADPANACAGGSSPFLLRYAGHGCCTTIGSNRHVWPKLTDGMFTVPLLIDDTPIVMFRLEDGQLLLTVQLLDRDNKLLVQVVDNELCYSVANWDVQFEGRTLTARSSPGHIFVNITFEPPNALVIARGHVFRNGIEVAITPAAVMVSPGRNSIAHSQAINCVGGLCLGDHPDLGGFVSMGVMRGDPPQDPDTESQLVRIGPSE